MIDLKNQPNKHLVVLIVRDIIKMAGGANERTYGPFIDMALSQVSEGQAKQIVDSLREQIREFDNVKAVITKPRKGVFD